MRARPLLLDRQHGHSNTSTRHAPLALGVQLPSQACLKLVALISHLFTKSSRMLLEYQAMIRTADCTPADLGAVGPSTGAVPIAAAEGVAGGVHSQLLPFKSAGAFCPNDAQGANIQAGPDEKRWLFGCCSFAIHEAVLHVPRGSSSKTCSTGREPNGALWVDHIVIGTRNGYVSPQGVPLDRGRSARQRHTAVRQTGVPPCLVFKLLL